ncbi:MAG: hypothetical protein SOV26_00205 [Candidatus Onthovivens sp.]|nr:hypothetical protein [Candidatus Onthovivens sp.]
MKSKILSILFLALFSPCLFSCNGQNNNGNSGENPGEREDVIFKFLKVESEPNKTEYEVGEKFTSEGLKVKLFTTTNDITDSGVDYDDYYLSINENFEFKEENITTSAKPLKIIVKSNDQSIKSTSFNVSIKEKEIIIEPVDITFGDFMRKLKDSSGYKISSSDFEGIGTKNAIYYTPKSGSTASSYGYAIRPKDNKIIKFHDKNGELIIDYSFGTNFTSFNSNDFENVVIDNFPDEIAYNAQIFTERDLEYFDNIQKRDNEAYTFKASKDGYDPDNLENSPTAVSHFIALTAHSQKPRSDFACAMLYASINYEVTLLNENSFLCNVTSGGTLDSYPYSTKFTITIDDNLNIPCLDSFMNE